MSAMRVIRYALWAAVVLLLIAIGAVYYLRDSGTAPLMAGASIGGPFTLTDQNGNTVTEASLKGHPSAIFFGYTSCPDICPTTLYDMTELMKELGPDADKLKVYFVSVDPERDTREVMAEYISAFDPRFTGLTGTREQVDQIVSAYRVYARKVDRDKGPYLMDHTATVYLLDDQGNFAGTLDYHEASETALAKLKRLIEAS